MAVARVRIVILSLALSIWPFPWTVPARAQGVGPSKDRQVRAGEMPVHEVKPGKIKVVVEARGSLEAARVADLYCPVEGQSTILSLVPEGPAVKKDLRLRCLFRSMRLAKGSTWGRSRG